jgi:serine/threonine-protein kinase
MGVVYRAKHALLRRPTAVKLLRAEAANGDRLSHFEREVQLTSSLTHPNTVAIYDYGRTPDGVFYYAMEYLDGISLQELVELDGPQSSSRTVAILVQVCGALAEAHCHGLIHRDVKPANIMLCERGGIPDVAKVLDFGLVRRLPGCALSRTDVCTSANSTIVGTPLYLAPEAILSPATVDARSDIYALGAVAYWLLAGRPVFEGSSVVEVCSRHIHSTPPALSNVPEELGRIVRACLAKDPKDRPPSMLVLSDALLACRGVSRCMPDDARDWWSRNRQRIRQSRVTRATTSRQTVVIDIETRA